MYYVYVLKNKKRGIYYGYTSNLEKRLKEHNTNHSGYTGKGEWECIYYEAYKDEKDARRREKALKGSGHTRRWLKDKIENSLNDENS